MNLYGIRIEVTFLSIISSCYVAMLYLGIPNAITLSLLASVCLSLIIYEKTRREIYKKLELSHWRRRLQRALQHQPYGIRLHFPKVNRVEHTTVGTKLFLTIRSGATAEDYEKVGPYLAVFFRIESALVIQNQTDASQIEITLRRINPLELPASQFPAIDNFKSSCWKPIPIGTDQVGRIVHYELFENNLLIGGAPGSGKTAVLTNLLLSTASDPKCTIFLFDPKEVDLAVFAHDAFRYVSTDITKAVETLIAIRTIMDSTYSKLKQARLRKLNRDGNIGITLVIIDELPFYVNHQNKEQAKAFTETLRDIISRGRACGISVVLVAQKPSAENVPTSIRDLVNCRIAMWSTTDEASNTVLGTSSASKGFSAAALNENVTGVGWLKNKGDTPILFRTYWVDDEALRDLSINISEARSKRAQMQSPREKVEGDR